jgi:hypothetical protein
MAMVSLTPTASKKIASDVDTAGKFTAGIIDNRGKFIADATAINVYQMQKCMQKM